MLHRVGKCSMGFSKYSTGWRMIIALGAQFAPPHVELDTSEELSPRTRARVLKFPFEGWRGTDLTPRGAASHASQAPYASATQSISKSAPLGSPETSTVARAGGESPEKKRP